MRMSISSILLVGCVSLTACSMKSVREEKSAETTKEKESASAAPASTATHTEASAPAEGVAATSPLAPAIPAQLNVAPPGAPIVKSHTAAATSVPAAASPAAAKKSMAPETTQNVAPEKALGWLKNGNIRYLKGSLRKDGQSSKDIQRLSTGQTPHTIVLSCSDSRVPPELVFDQKLGEIFVVRNAGEIPDDASVASIEYAVEHLGARLIVVMGHTSCGAVKAALATLDGGDAGSPALNVLVQDIHPRLASFKGKKPSPGVQEESWANARGISQELLERSEILRSKAASGQISIKTALYHLDDGKVDFDQ